MDISVSGGQKRFLVLLLLLWVQRFKVSPEVLCGCRFVRRVQRLFRWV